MRLSGMRIGAVIRGPRRLGCLLFTLPHASIEYRNGHGVARGPPIARFVEFDVIVDIPYEHHLLEPLQALHKIASPHGFTVCRAGFLAPSLRHSLPRQRHVSSFLPACFFQPLEPHLQVLHRKAFGRRLQRAFDGTEAARCRHIWIHTDLPPGRHTVHRDSFAPS
jgi:hypothetical protein